MTKLERASQLWPILALAATNRQVLTYDLVYRLTGISGMTRQFYYSELLYKLKESSFITKQQIYELNFAVNMILNTFQLDSHNMILSEISMKSNKTVDDIKLFIENNHKFSESLKYIQIGNPENIIIIPDNSILVQQNLAPNR